MGAFSGPETADSGIVLALDAANTRSYVGSGTTWTDLIGSNNGTLTNGPVFTQEPKLEPFGGAGAVSFDGSGDNLNFTNIDVGTGDFTYEGWIYPTGASLIPLIIWHNGTSKVHTFGLCSDSNANNSRSMFGANARPVASNSWIVSSAISVNTWHHIAFVRVSGTLKIYVDGTEQSTSAGSGSGGGDPSSYSTDVSYIGSNANSSEYFVGRISNARVISGTALYTSNFTPKRQPLIPESAPNTVLLTCQKGTIRDRSSSAHAITINGDAKSISGASYFDFDGTNDYVAIASNSNFNLGTGDFAVEIWVYLNDITSNSGFVGIINRHNYSTNTGWGIWKDSGGKFGFWYNASTKINGTTNVSTNSWYHIVATRLGSTITLYVNGVSENSATNSSFTDSSTSLGIGVANVGGAWNDTYPVNGYISNTRVYKGKGLTAAEVKQNYRNTKGRYGL